MSLEALAGALDSLAALDPAQLADGDAVVELHRLGARLEAVTTRAVAAFEASGNFCAEGARSAAAWLAGEVSAAHVGLLVRARNRTTAEALARDEALLVGHARTLRFADGEIVSGELGRIETELFEADRAEAKARLGRDPHPDELARSAAQRRADALVEMATRPAGSSGSRPVPLFSVLVDFPTLTGRICELASGTVVSPGALLPWLDSADIERAVWRAPNRIEVSERARLFTGAPGGPSSCATGPAPTPTATCRCPAARPTTSSPTAPAGPPPRRTGGCSAGSTTGPATSGPRRTAKGQPRVQATMARHISSDVPSPHVTKRGGSRRISGRSWRSAGLYVQVICRRSPGCTVTGWASGYERW